MNDEHHNPLSHETKLIKCGGCLGWFAANSMHPCPEYEWHDGIPYFINKRSTPMTMDPGTSKVDLYDPCTNEECDYPFGKAHVHNGDMGKPILQVVVRRLDLISWRSIERQVQRMNECQTEEAKRQVLVDLNSMVQQYMRQNR